MIKRILGVDPGSVKAGYALIEKNGRQFKYIKSGVLKFDAKQAFIDRISHIHLEMRDVIEELVPCEVAFESLVFVKNANSLAKLSQARGAMIAACAKIPLFEYAPNLIKSTVTHDGHASKEGVSKVLEMVFGKMNFQTHDESDALAIALCHGLLGGKQNDRPLMR